MTTHATADDNAQSNDDTSDADLRQAKRVTAVRDLVALANEGAFAALLERDVEAAADIRDLAVVLARDATDTGRRTSLDEVMEASGQTRESLDALPDE